MRVAAIAILALVACSGARAQGTVDDGAAFANLLSSFTGGSTNVTAGASYLYGLGTGLANGFQSTLTDLYDSFLNGTAKDEVSNIVNKFESTFCKNATYTPSSKTPPSFTGPGASLTIAGGACVFNQTEFAVSGGDIQIDCVGPSVVIKKTPAVLQSASKTSETFTSSSCSVTNTIDDKLQAKINATLDKPTDIFGKAKPQESTQVLFVFDNKPSILNLTDIGQQLEGEFENVLGSVNAVLGGNGTQVASALQSSLGQQAESSVQSIVGAQPPSISYLIDELSHNLP